MKKIYVAFADIGGIGGYAPKAIASSTRKRGLIKFAINIANENHKKVGIVKKELVYIDYKSNDIFIEEIPLLEIK